MVSFEWSIRILILNRFLKSKYGKRLRSGGTDSQIFIAENLNVDSPCIILGVLTVFCLLLKY